MTLNKLIIKYLRMNFLMITALLIPFLLGSCGEKGTPDQDDGAHKHTPETENITELQITSRQFKAAGIDLGGVQQTTLSGSLKVSGTLDVPPQNYAEVSAYIGGVIKSIHVIEGDHVKKGQLVMTLEHPDFIRLQEDYISARSDFEYLEKEYIRQKELYSQKVASAKVFQEAEAKYTMAKGRLASLESQLSMINVNIKQLNQGKISRLISLLSPIEGYVAHVHGSIGSYAEPNKMLFDVVNNHHVHVHLDVFEKDFYKIKVGQKVTVTLPNQNNTEIEAEIFKIGKAMDNNTKSIAVHADIKNNKNLELIPGIFINAAIHTGGQPVLAVPVDAVVRSGDKQYVFIVNKVLCSKPPVKGQDPCMVRDADGKMIPLAYKMIAVRTGTEEKGQVEISPAEPIAMDDQLVVKGAYYLISALKSGETVGCCAPEEKKEK